MARGSCVLPFMTGAPGASRADQQLRHSTWPAVQWPNGRLGIWPLRVSSATAERQGWPFGRCKTRENPSGIARASVIRGVRACRRLIWEATGCLRLQSHHPKFLIQCAAGDDIKGKSVTACRRICPLLAGSRPDCRGTVRPNVRTTPLHQQNPKVP